MFIQGKKLSICFHYISGNANAQVYIFREVAILPWRVVVIYYIAI